MTDRQKVLANAEAFVREVLSKDFKQPVDEAKVRKAAQQASKVIPVKRHQKLAEGLHGEMSS